MSTGSEFTGAIRNRSSQMDYERIANGLGWFSIGLGLVEIAAPSTIANLIGVEDDRRNPQTATFAALWFTRDRGRYGDIDAGGSRRLGVGTCCRRPVGHQLARCCAWFPR